MIPPNANRVVTVPSQPSNTPPTTTLDPYLIISGLVPEVFLLLTLSMFYFFKEKLQKYVFKKKIMEGYFTGKSRDGDRPIYQDIQYRLELIRVQTGADRVIFLQFHNSQKLLNDFHVLKWSISHQSLSPAIAPVENKTEQPIIKIIDEISLVRQNKISWVHDSDEKYGKCTRYLMKEGIKLICLVFIENRWGVPIGIIGIHFCRDVMDEDHNIHTKSSAPTLEIKKCITHNIFELEQIL